MPSPWQAGDFVQIQVGKPYEPVWCNAVIDERIGADAYRCRIIDDPRPSLEECGISHWAVPSSSPINAICVVREYPNTLGIVSIRDPS